MNIIKQAIAEGRPSLGVWVTSGAPILAELAGRAGLDWVILDTQHGAISEAGLLPCLQAVSIGGTPALVRVGSDDPRLIMRALDLGAAGVVVPLVSTPAQAAAAVAATRYPPAGIRSFGPVRRYYDPGAAGAEGGGDPLCLAMIETAAGLENVEAIAATPGLDGVFIGPVDLGLDLGLGIVNFAELGELRSPVEQVVAAAKRHGIIAGAASLSPATIEPLLDLGIELTTIGGEMGYVTRGLAADAARRRELIGKYSTRESA